MSEARTVSKMLLCQVRDVTAGSPMEGNGIRLYTDLVWFELLEGK